MTQTYLHITEELPFVSYNTQFSMSFFYFCVNISDTNRRGTLPPSAFSCTTANRDHRHPDNRYGFLCLQKLNNTRKDFPLKIQTSCPLFLTHAWPMMLFLSRSHQVSTETIRVLCDFFSKISHVQQTHCSTSCLIYPKWDTDSENWILSYLCIFLFPHER